MSGESYTFTFHQDSKTLTTAMRTRPPAGFPKVAGTGWAFGVKLVQCVMLGLGALGLGVAVEYLLSGQIGVNFWGTALGVVLLYIAVFGALFVTLPSMVRTALATRANQGPVRMTLSSDGLHTQMTHFQSQVAWAGLEGVSRTKTSFVFWLGANRPSLPFHAFESPAQIETVDEAIKRWLEASR